MPFKIEYGQTSVTSVAWTTVSLSAGFTSTPTIIIMLVGVPNIIDVHVVGAGAVLRGAVICFYLSNEGLRLLENAAYMGLPIPDKLREILAQLHDRDKKESEDRPADDNEDGDDAERK